MKYKVQDIVLQNKKIYVITRGIDDWKLNLLKKIPLLTFYGIICCYDNGVTSIEGSLQILYIKILATQNEFFDFFVQDK